MLVEMVTAPSAPASAMRLASRDYLTCRYGNSVWYKDHRTWFFSQVDFEAPHVFDLEADPSCRENIASQASDRIEQAKNEV